METAGFRTSSRALRKALHLLKETRASGLVGNQRRHSSSVAICDDAKAKLRMLYRRIHPDLFFGDDKRSQVNERSFKLLQDFVLNASQAGPSASHQASAPHYHAAYVLEFYIDKSCDDITEEEFAKISLTLPAPSSVSPMVTRRNLNKLFRAVDIDELECDDAYRDTYKSMPLSLREFIPLVQDQYLVDLTDTSTPDVSLRMMLAALHHSRRLRIVFAKDAESSTQSAIGKVGLLRDFVEKCLDESPAELGGGLTVGFGKHFSQDVRNGAIWLDASASPESWARFLNNLDLKQFHEALETRSAVRQLAYQAALPLGVASIYSADDSTDAEVDSYESYESFLLSLLRWTPPESVTYEGVDLIVATSAVSKADMEKDIDRGILYVSSADSPAKIYEMLKKYGRRAEQHVHRRRQVAAQTKALVSQVERTLRLRLLSKHPSLEDYRYKAACQKLLANANELQVLEGLKLRVGEKNAYVTGRGLIDIAWDFRV